MNDRPTTDPLTADQIKALGTATEQAWQALELLEHALPELAPLARNWRVADGTEPLQLVLDPLERLAAVLQRWQVLPSAASSSAMRRVEVHAGEMQDERIVTFRDDRDAARARCRVDTEDPAQLSIVGGWIRGWLAGEPRPEELRISDQPAARPDKDLLATGSTVEDLLPLLGGTTPLGTAVALPRGQEGSQSRYEPPWTKEGVVRAKRALRRRLALAELWHEHLHLEEQLREVQAAIQKQPGLRDDHEARLRSELGQQEALLSRASDRALLRAEYLELEERSEDLDRSEEEYRHLLNGLPKDANWRVKIPRGAGERIASRLGVPGE